MSRMYSMQIMVDNYNKEKEEDIQETVRESWNIDDSWKEGENQITWFGEDNLSGGESEDEFSERVAKDIWEANDGFCEVNINATYLEDLPYESYGFDKDDYKKWKEGE